MVNHLRLKDDISDASAQKEQNMSASIRAKPTQAHWYSIPHPIRRVFEQYPLITYRENSLPQRALRIKDTNTLFIFINPYDTTGATLSCNPACLKWQAYLRFNDIDFSVAASNNHASPSGSLPFLIPASSPNEPSCLPITTGKISRWVSQQAMQEEEVLDIKQEAYMSLIDQNIRNAWLHHLYVNKDNFAAVAHRLYVSIASSNRFVQMTIAHQLREAAKHELLKSMQIIDEEDIYVAADRAFKSLSKLLADEHHFSKDNRPGLFDASLFAYTHLLLDEHLPWSDKSLQILLQRYPQLIDHRQRLLQICASSQDRNFSQ